MKEVANYSARSIEIDEDVREECWCTIRNLPEEFAARDADRLPVKARRPILCAISTNIFART
jgi:hypothetical protein